MSFCFLSLLGYVFFFFFTEFLFQELHMVTWTNSCFKIQQNTLQDMVILEWLHKTFQQDIVLLLILDFNFLFLFLFLFLLLFLFDLLFLFSIFLFFLQFFFIIVANFVLFCYLLLFNKTKKVNPNILKQSLALFQALNHQPFWLFKEHLKKEF